ncbi:hypothetical protein HGM15179_016233 [Zosterops borbonicus]|uniref:Uncharacterized protein n=1 Tax=Zosterops borbonicus TaxID=364589 RepID=A0A8K1G302_9PASS|nr:hypothetical protein HGM15179_016233 [Zosterops borbonicus]
MTMEISLCETLIEIMCNIVRPYVALGKMERLTHGGAKIVREQKEIVQSIYSQVLEKEAREQRSENVSENQSADTKVSAEEGGEGAPDAEAKISLQTMVKTLYTPAAHENSEIHLQPMEEPHTRAGGCLNGDCDAMGSVCWSRVLAGTCTPMEKGDHIEANFLVGLLVLCGIHSGADCT